MSSIIDQKHKLQFDNKLAKLDEYFTNQKLKLVKNYEGDRLDINFSRHFLERIIQHKLEKDLSYIMSMVECFVDNVYYHTSHTNRRYLLNTRHLRIGVSISTGAVSNRRYCVICTVYPDDKENWYNDETINLKPTKR